MSFVEHPFSRLPRDELVRALSVFGREQAERFPTLLKEMQSTIDSVDALHAIATLANYGMMGTITTTGERRPLLNDARFTQSHVELIQALALRTAEDRRSYQPALPDAIQKLLDGLPALAEAFHHRRLVEIETERPSEEKAVLALQEHLRAHTQLVRNWGYYHRVVRTLHRLFSPIDNLFVEVNGVAATVLISLFENLIDTKEAQATGRFKKLSGVISQNTVQSVIRAYYGVYPEMGGSADEMIAFLEEGQCSLDEARCMVLSHSELALPLDAMFDAHEIAERMSLDGAGLRAALDKLSLAFGDLAGENAEHFFLTNPVWTKPLIKLAEGKYYSAIPSTLFSFAFPALEELLRGSANALTTYFDRRASFLEEEISRLFREAFPTCEHVANYRWKDAGQEFESDLMVRVDSHLLLVEAKSGKVSWPALRGAPGRAKDHAQELLLEPSQQSLRLKQRIEQVLYNPQLQHELFPDLAMDLSKVRKVLRLSVTLEDFAILQSNLHLLRKAGWIPSDHPLAPCILLSDLEIVFDILELLPMKLHYIQRRAELEERTNYVGDETDLLAFYLETGFNIGQAELGSVHLNLLGASKPIDAYYMGIDDDVSVRKPTVRMTQWWLDLCVALERRQFHQWSEVAVVLQNFSFEEQQQILRSFKKLVKNVRKRWREPNHPSVLNVMPAAHRTDALAIHAFRDNHAGDRKERIRNIAAQVFESGAHVNRCVVIAVNIDRESYPYSTLAVLYPGREGSGEINFGG